MIIILMPKKLFHFVFFAYFHADFSPNLPKRNETEWDDAIEMSSYWSHLIAQKWKWWKWKNEKENSTKCFIRNWKMIMSWWRTHVCRLYAADEWASITFSEKKRKIVKKVGGRCVGVEMPFNSPLVHMLIATFRKMLRPQPYISRRSRTEKSNRNRNRIIQNSLGTKW